MKKTVKEAADSLLQRGEITQEEYNYIEKNGGFKVPEGISKFMANAGKAMNTTAGKVLAAGSAATGLLTAGYLTKELAVDPIVQSIKLKNSYDQLMKKTPQLQSQDPETVKDYFNIVKTYSPAVAANPIVAGALVNKMIEFGGVDHKLIMDLLEMQQKVPTMGAMPLLIGAGSKIVADPNIRSTSPESKIKVTKEWNDYDNKGVVTATHSRSREGIL
jgi:hypothetical protein